MIGVYVITENRCYRDGLEQALRLSGRVQVVGTAAHPADALPEVVTLRPGVALLDLSTDGPAWVWELGAAAPETRVLALGLGEAEQEVVAWAEAGVAGYVGREACLDELLEAIEGAVRGEAHCSGGMGAILLRRIVRGPFSQEPMFDRERRLTSREGEIVRLVAKGLSNQQIARSLCIALPTVKNHMHNILEKLGVHRRFDAVREIRRFGLVSPERR